MFLHRSVHLCCRVVYAFGKRIREPVQDITPTYLSQRVLGVLRECDSVASSVLEQSGKPKRTVDMLLLLACFGTLLCYCVIMAVHIVIKHRRIIVSSADFCTCSLPDAPLKPRNPNVAYSPRPALEPRLLQARCGG